VIFALGYNVNLELSLTLFFIALFHSGVAWNTGEKALPPHACRSYHHPGVQTIQG